MGAEGGQVAGPRALPPPGLAASPLLSRERAGSKARKRFAVTPHAAPAGLPTSPWAKPCPAPLPLPPPHSPSPPALQS